jgi:hypothetical protein
MRVSTKVTAPAVTRFVGGGVAMLAALSLVRCSGSSIDSSGESARTHRDGASDAPVTTSRGGTDAGIARDASSNGGLGGPRLDVRRVCPSRRPRHIRRARVGVGRRSGLHGRVGWCARCANGLVCSCELHRRLHADGQHAASHGRVRGPRDGVVRLVRAVFGESPLRPGLYPRRRLLPIFSRMRGVAPSPVRNATSARGSGPHGE